MVMVGIKPDVKYFYQGQCNYTPGKGWSCQVLDGDGKPLETVGFHPTKDECRQATLQRVIELVKGVEG